MGGSAGDREIQVPQRQVASGSFGGGAASHSAVLSSMTAWYRAWHAGTSSCTDEPAKEFIVPLAGTVAKVSLAGRMSLSANTRSRRLVLWSTVTDSAAVEMSRSS